MQRRDINAADAPAPAGQYTQAVEVTGATRTRWHGAICRRNVSAQFTAHSILRRDGAGMVSTINEVDTTDERSLKPFES